MNFGINNNEIETLSKCSVCNSSNSYVISEVFTKEVCFFSTSICKECGFVYRNIRPKFDWLVNCWRERDEHQKSLGIIPIDSEVENNRIQRYKSLEFFLSSIVKNKSILDIGSGTGSGLKSFKEAGWKVTGIEADASRARYGINKYGIETIVDVIENINVDKKYPVVTSIHSLEHFYDPEKKLELMASFVEDGGYLYIEVPDALTHVLDWSDNFFLGHLSNFSENNLGLLGVKFGLNPIFRTFPKSKHNGVKNLGILFKKEKSEVLKYPIENIKKNILNIVKAYHSNRVSEKDKLKIYLPEINDLSIGYKGESKQSKFDIVSSNCLKKVSKNEYFVRDCSNSLSNLVEKIKSLNPLMLRNLLNTKPISFFRKLDKNFLVIQYTKFRV